MHKRSRIREIKNIFPIRACTGQAKLTLHMELKLENRSKKGSQANYKLSHHMELKLEKGDCHPARERKKRIKPFGFKHGQLEEFVNEDKKRKQIFCMTI